MTGKASWVMRVKVEYTAMVIVAAQSTSDGANVVEFANGQFERE